MQIAETIISAGGWTRANNDSCTGCFGTSSILYFSLTEQERGDGDHWAWSSRRESTSWALHVWTVCSRDHEEILSRGHGPIQTSIQIQKKND